MSIFKKKNVEEGLIIQPKRNLLDVNLNELWNYRDLILLFVRRDFVAKYKQTILGPLWFIIQPLLTTLMFTVVFGRIAGLSSDGLPRMLFYLSGIVCWNYFSQSLILTSNTFTQNVQIFGKVYFPRLSIPVSAVISNLILFAVQFVLFLVVLLMFVFRGTLVSPNWELMWFLPLLIILLAGLALGFGIIISSLTTKYRDLTHLVTFGVQLWMYATPVIYPLSEIKHEKYRLLILSNPVSSLVEAFRNMMMGVGIFEWKYLFYSIGFCLGIMTVGVLLFNKIEQNFMDTV